MPKRSSKNPTGDLNTTAFNVVNQATGNLNAQASSERFRDNNDKRSRTPMTEKNPAAVALGKLGGLKGGKARAKALSSGERKAIAQKAAEKKWKRYYETHPKQ